MWPPHRRAVDLLITDIVMPGGMSGRERAEGLQSVAPRLRVISTSGYRVEIAGGGLNLEEGLNYLPKPFSASQLAHTVRTMLDC